MLASKNGKWIKAKATGPLVEMEVEAGFAWFDDDKTAVVEMASASGIELLRSDQYNPMKTTTYGTGELIVKAAAMKPDRILVAVGGSATVDGGTGAAAALGWKLLDSKSKPIEPGGKGLEALCKIKPPDEKLSIPVDVLCDVKNPLLGNLGAAAVFGPQKGASPGNVVKLENGLAKLRDIVKRDLGKEINVKGGGAAGGLSAGLMAFADAAIVPGITEVIKVCNLTEEIKKSDIVVTGEGCFDSQSLGGKVVSGIAKVARKYEKEVFVIAGSVKTSPEQYRPLGITEAFACAEKEEIEKSIRQPELYLTKAAERLALFIRKSRLR
jgi:glycerate kinase